MDKEKEIEKLDNELVVIFENVLYGVDDIHYCIDFDEITPIFDEQQIGNDTPAELLTRYLQTKGYGNVKQYKEETERLSTELSHREEDLIHADEKVFYREVNVALNEKEIKKQAVKEFAERLKTELQLKIEISNRCYEHENDEHNYYGMGLCLGGISGYAESRTLIDDLIKELYGEEEE